MPRENKERTVERFMQMAQLGEQVLLLCREIGGRKRRVRGVDGDGASVSASVPPKRPGRPAKGAVPSASVG